MTANGEIKDDAATSIRHQVCPEDCPDKEKHQAYADRMARWHERLKIDPASTIANSDWSVVHKLTALDSLGANHDKTCRLLYGSRSLTQELASGFSLLLDVAPEEILSKFQVTCGLSSELEAFSFVANPAARAPYRIVLSHGLHLFCLNCNVISGAIFDFGEAGQIPRIGVDRARKLLLDQLYYFWVQGDKNDLLFPYDEFDLDTYSKAATTTLLSIAFLLAHEMSHILISSYPENTRVVQVQNLAADFAENGFPPPFGEIAPEGWKERWIDEFACDALGALGMLACTDKAKQAAFIDAPTISDHSRAWRQHAMESLNLFMDALYLRNLNHVGVAGDIGLNVAYSASHPMPQLRRLFVRLIAATFSNPKLLIQTDRFEQAFKTLFDREDWLPNKFATSNKASTQTEADSVVPQFIQKYEASKGHLDLVSAASMATEALNYKQRYANTTYEPQLNAIEEQLRAEMATLSSAPILARLLDIAKDGRYSAAMTVLDEMEQRYSSQVESNEIAKKMFEDLRIGLRKAAADFTASGSEHPPAGQS